MRRRDGEKDGEELVGLGKSVTRLHPQMLFRILAFKKPQHV